MVASLPGQVIMVGDMNCTLDPGKDRSTGVDTIHVNSRKQILHFIGELNLVDIWRHLNPKQTAYSCYSATHQTYSRIDYFLVSAQLLSKCIDCHYLSHVWSCISGFVVCRFKIS